MFGVIKPAEVLLAKYIYVLVLNSCIYIPELIFSVNHNKVLIFIYICRCSSESSTAIAAISHFPIDSIKLVTYVRTYVRILRIL